MPSPAFTMLTPCHACIHRRCQAQHEDGRRSSRPASAPQLGAHARPPRRVGCSPSGEPEPVSIILVLRRHLEDNGLTGALPLSWSNMAQLEHMCAHACLTVFLVLGARNYKPSLHAIRVAGVVRAGGAVLAPPQAQPSSTLSGKLGLRAGGHDDPQYHQETTPAMYMVCQHATRSISKGVVGRRGGGVVWPPATGDTTDIVLLLCQAQVTA
jgi:hypothetical protein